MSGDRPIPVLVTDDAPRRRRKRAAGPLMVGLIAAVVATWLMGVTGAVAALFAVGSWWAYKFWPRPAAPIEPEAQAFIDRLEGVRPDEVDLRPTKPGSSADAFEDLQL